MWDIVPSLHLLQKPKLSKRLSQKLITKTSLRFYYRNSKNYFEDGYLPK